MIYINCMRIVHWMLSGVAVAALVACGGGGGGSSSNAQAVVPPGTISTFAVTGVTISDPKHMAFLPGGSDLFVANQTRNEVLRIDATGQGAVYSSINSPFGLAFSDLSASDPTNTLYAVASFTAGNGVALASLAANPLKISVNGYGLAFSSNKAYVADISNSQLVTRDLPGWNNPATIAMGGQPNGVVFDGNDNLYITINGTPGQVKRYEISTGTTTNLNLGTVTLSLPNALALDGAGNLYVVNKGNNVGDNGTLVKIANPTGVPNATVFVDVGMGLCAAAGLAYRDGYLYVSNGSTCTEANGVPNQNTILKVKT
jgi:hypothetical protein